MEGTLDYRANRDPKVVESPGEVPIMAHFDKDDPDAARKMQAMFSPGQVDQHVRQGIMMCWMMLPEDRKTPDELEKQFRRIVDRALKDLREDADAFGLRT
jgi:hypothetical protein